MVASAFYITWIPVPVSSILSRPLRSIRDRSIRFNRVMNEDMTYRLRSQDLFLQIIGELYENRNSPSLYFSHLYIYFFYFFIYLLSLFYFYLFNFVLCTRFSKGIEDLPIRAVIAAISTLYWLYSHIMFFSRTSLSHIHTYRYF